MAVKKIIIDADPGQDDAIAILLALASPQDIEVLGITAVAGNVPLDLTQKNARIVCELAKRTDIPVTKIVPVDATGAGDQFAAGFLFGLVSGRDMETCGRMGNVCAAEVISHIGPRPEVDMKALFAEHGLL